MTVKQSGDVRQTTVRRTPAFSVTALDLNMAAVNIASTKMDAYLISLTVTKNVICEYNVECYTYHVSVSRHPRLNLAFNVKVQMRVFLSMHTNSRHYYGNILYCNIIHTVAYEKFMFYTFPFVLKLKNTSASRSESSEVDHHLSGLKGPVFERKPPRVTRKKIKIHPRSMEKSTSVCLGIIFVTQIISGHHVGRSMLTWVSLPLPVTAFSAATWRHEAMFCMLDPNGHDVHSFRNSMEKNVSHIVVPFWTHDFIFYF